MLFPSTKVDTVFNFEVSSPQSFRFTEDGKYMYGVSYYSGVSNVYRVDVASRNISAMSNSLTGLFRPLELSRDSLLAFRFCSDGFRPVKIPNRVCKEVASIQFLGNQTIEKHPVLKDWQLPFADPKKMDLDKIKTGEGKYQANRLLHLNYAYPIVTGYKNFVGLGYAFNLSDPLGFNSVDFNKIGRAHV